METPILNHITKEDYELIYEPAEDSFLLLDALEADLLFISNLKPITCVEIGVGSGIIVTALSKKLPSTVCLGTDINLHACTVSKKTAIKNGTHVDFVCTNLIDSLRPSSIDILIFNPPYVPTPDNEGEQSLIAHSWAGGLRGRKIIDKLLGNLESILSAKGVLYLLVLKENSPDEIISIAEQSGFKGIKFMERRIPGEYLYVLKIWK